jgi:hypothetical protein
LLLAETDDVIAAVEDAGANGRDTGHNTDALGSLEINILTTITREVIETAREGPRHRSP